MRLAGRVSWPCRYLPPGSGDILSGATWGARRSVSNSGGSTSTILAIEGHGGVANLLSSGHAGELKHTTTSSEVDLELGVDFAEQASVVPSGLVLSQIEALEVHLHLSHFLCACELSVRALAGIRTRRADPGRGCDLEDHRDRSCRLSNCDFRGNPRTPRNGSSR